MTARLGYAALAGLIALRFDQVEWFGQTIVRGGGVIGDFLADTLKSWFNTVGAALFLLIGLIVSAILVARFSTALYRTYPDRVWVRRLTVVALATAPVIFAPAREVIQAGSA